MSINLYKNYDKQLNTINESLAEKAANSDSNRTTTAKDVTGAINEIKALADTKADQSNLNTTNNNVAANTTAIANIGNASPKGTYATLADLQTAYPSGTTGIFLITADGQWYYWNGTAWTAGGVYQATGSSEFMATNLLTNGNFSNGTAGGWSAVNSTHSVSNNILTNTADGTATTGSEINYLSNLVIGHKYYLRGLVKAKSDVCDYISINMLKSSNGAQIVATAPINGNIYDVSYIFTATDITSGFSFVHKYVDAATANGKSIELQYVDIIDLTATFGAGNEPSVTQINQIISGYPNGYIAGSVAPFADNKVMMNILNVGFQPKNNNLNGLSSLQNNSGLNGIVVQTGDGAFVDRRIIGTANQITVTNGNGISDHPTISIPKNPMLMQPVTAVPTFGSELAPVISSWTGLGGATFDGSKWTIPAKGQLKAPIAVESGAEYQIDITWTATNDYAVQTIPKLIVSLGTVSSVGQFAGYSDALYKLTLTANTNGTVDLVLGDGIEDWYATITNVSVKKVTAKVTPAGKLGVGSFDVTTMSDNIAIGSGLQKRTSGGSNYGFGLGALRDITTGSFNVAMGISALEQNDTGLNNIGIGSYALRYLRSGYYNIGIGYSAMVNNISGSWNVAIGNEVMRDLTTGIRNTVIGSRAMNDLTTGSFNVAIGREAGLYPNEVSNSTKTGSNNVFIGYRSGQSYNENTDESTAIGSYATVRNRATAIGRKTQAGGVGSVAIGTDSTGTGAEASAQDEFVLGTVLHKVKIPGVLNMTGIATADPHVAGQIWSNSGVLTVSVG